MKIGLLTFHRPLNYGAVLQAYALQKKLLSLGVDCEIIDYRPRLMELQYYSIINPEVSFIRNLLKIYNRPTTSKKIRYYQEFTKKNLVLSNKVYYPETEKDIDVQYDYVIVGSDQVWNPTLTGNDDIFFLNNLVQSEKKISYAASMGDKCFDEIMINYCVNMIKDFSAISVREKSLAEALSKYSIKSDVSIDPTLFLNKEDWNKIIPTEKISNEEYILIYTVAKPKNLYTFAEKLSGENGIPIVFITNSNRRIVSGKRIRDCSVEDFLRYIRDAKYVFTSSFHCTVFSILFHKQFIVETIGNGSINNRINDLLDALSLQKQDISKENLQDTLNPIDWEQSENKLNLLRYESERYLQNAIFGSEKS